MRRPLETWASCIGALVALDIWCDRRRNNSTLSCQLRRIFHTDRKSGRLAFIAAWAGLTAFIVPHICRRISNP
jgi:hypothetical protein